MNAIRATALAVTSSLAITGAAMAQDAAKGQSVFNQCKACHMLDKALVGPPLKGVVGRKAGSVPGYSYSALMKAAGDAGLVWNEAEIADYIKNPNEFLKTYVSAQGKPVVGTAKMIFMLANEDQRKNVVAYLAQQK